MADNEWWYLENFPKTLTIIQFFNLPNDIASLPTLIDNPSKNKPTLAFSRSSWLVGLLID